MEQKAYSEDAVFERAYDQLRQIAAHLLGSGAGHTLQPTAIVHEAFIKLTASDPNHWESESHILAVAAKAMRHVLVDQYRATSRLKRGGGRQACTLDTSLIDPGVRPADPLEIHEALMRLAGEDERAAAVVEMRFFGGMTHAQIGKRLCVSEPTVRRDWRFARAWLREELAAEGGAS